MNDQHKELAAGRWKEELSLAAQMANIGSEVSRALNWEKKSHKEYCRKTAARALELLDFSLDCAEESLIMLQRNSASKDCCPRATIFMQAGMTIVEYNA